MAIKFQHIAERVAGIMATLDPPEARELLRVIDEWQQAYPGNHAVVLTSGDHDGQMFRAIKHGCEQALEDAR